MSDVKIVIFYVNKYYGYLIYNSGSVTITVDGWTQIVEHQAVVRNLYDILDYDIKMAESKIKTEGTNTINEIRLLTLKQIREVCILLKEEGENEV